MTNNPNWPSYQFRAMGSSIGVWLDTDPAIAQKGFAIAEQLFATHEAALTRFRSDSELSQFNAQAGRWVAVSPLLWRLTQMAVALAQETDGLFDPTLLNAIEAAGYTRSFEAVNNKAAATTSTETLTGRWREIEFDERKQAVKLPEGVKLDLGGIAKGDTAQVVVDALRDIAPVLVDAGGDLAAGAAPDGRPGWPVAVAQPSANDGDDQDLFSLWLSNGALATSGIDYRHWEQNGRRQHHIMHPYTGRPAETDLVTVTVWHEEISQAEAWATAALVAGRDAGFDLLVDLGATAVLIDHNQHLLLTEPMLTRAIWADRPFV